MPRRRSRLRLGTGLSLTRRDPVVRAGLGGRVVQDLAVRDPVDQGRVVRGLVGRDRVARVDPHLVDLADIRHLAVRAGLVRVLRDPVVQVDPVDPDREDLVDLVDQGMDLADRVDPDRVDLVDLDLGRLVGLDLAARVDLVEQGMDPVGLADRVDPDRADLVDRAGPAGPAGLVIRADRHRRRTRRGVPTTGVAPRWAAPGMYLTASAHPVTVRRLRPHNTDGVGMAGLHPERRRLSGTDRRPRVAGTVHRLPVVGTAHGMGRRAIWR
jgi:hypothetical protein